MPLAEAVGVGFVVGVVWGTLKVFEESMVARNWTEAHPESLERLPTPTEFTAATRK